MKKSKILALILALGVSTSLFASCGGTGTGNTDSVEQSISVEAGKTEYTYEAEDTDISDLSGVAYSGNFPGYTMVRGKNSSSIYTNDTVFNSISGEYFVSYLNAAGLILEFVIEADKASTANDLYIRMGSEFGTLTINPENIAVTVNDEVLDYEEFYVKGEAGSYKSKFTSTKLGQIDLVEGTNTIEVEILTTTEFGINGQEGAAFGPGIDCIQIISEAELAWEKLLVNYLDQLTQD